MGIFLIVLGYVAASVGFDYKDNFIFYLLAPIIVLILLWLLFIYNIVQPYFRHRKFFYNRFVFSVVFTLFSILIIYSMYLFKEFAIVAAFLGSFTLVLIIIIIFLESNVISMIVNIIFERIKGEVLKKIDSEIDKVNSGFESNRDEAMKLYELLNSANVSSLKDDKPNTEEE
jgi:hypothetical protein